MNFSITSVLTTVIFSSAIIVIILLFIRRKSFVNIYSIMAIVLCLLAVSIRMVFPFETNLTQTIAVTAVLPDVTLFLYSNLITIGKSNVCVYHVLYTAWGIGIFISLSLFIKKYLKAIRQINKLQEHQDKHMYMLLQQVLDKHKKVKSFKIVKAPIGVTPFIAGFMNPIIILPDIDFSSDELFHILNHEVTHYYKGDIWIKSFLEILCMLYWWNPLIYVLKRQTAEMLEIHTDISVIRFMDELERIEYLESIVKAAKSCALSKTSMQILTFSSYADSNTEHVLKQRFHTVLEYSEDKKITFKDSIGIIAIFAITILLLFFSVAYIFEPYRVSAVDVEGTFVLNKNNSYLVENMNGGYDVYMNDEFLFNIIELDDSLFNLHIYKNLEEAKQNESN